MPPRTRAATYARRRKRRMDAVGHDLSTTQWTALKETWGGCAYCGAVGEDLQKDCVLPISRGGRYTLSNVVPACRSCNASKCNAEVTSWMRRKRLDERTFLERWTTTLRALTTTPAPDQARVPATAPSISPLHHDDVRRTP